MALRELSEEVEVAEEGLASEGQEMASVVFVLAAWQGKTGDDLQWATWEEQAAEWVPEAVQTMEVLSAA